jgi:hypothetical protein
MSDVVFLHLAVPRRETARIVSMATTRKSKTSGSRKTSSKSKTSKRTVMEPHKGDKRYVRRNTKGQFKTEVNVGRSLSADRRRTAKTKIGKGQGDRGDT